MVRPLPRRRFVLFRALCQVLLPLRKPAPPVQAMAAPAVIPLVTALVAPAVIRPVTALVAPAVIRPVTALADPVVIRRVPVVSVLVAPLAAPVAPAVRRVLLAAPALVARLAALDSRVRLPHPLIPATDRAKRSALRAAVRLISSRAILVAAPTMTTVVV